MKCELVEFDRRGQSIRYTCESCGRITAWIPAGRRVVATCQPRNAKAAETHWANCPHRGPVIATVNARTAGCGCCGSTVDVFQCQRFAEPVLVHAADRCSDKIREAAPGYAGRTCRACRLSEQCDILHVTPRPDWQHVTARGRFALDHASLSLRVAEHRAAGPTELDRAIRDQLPRLVFLHAFPIRADLVLPIVRRWPAVRFVAVNHSQENHTFTWPQYFGEIRDLLAASRKLPNLWYAGSDAAQHWQTLGYRRAIRWHWPCEIQPWQDPPAVDPPTVLITSRADLVKALPSQILAAALLQRSHGCRVAMAANNASQQRQDGLAALIAAAGLQVEAWPWLGHAEFLDRLRRDVSIVLQPSMSETFNYVSWEAGSVGRPWVGSDAIRHTPSGWRADPNDPADIARVAAEILADYSDASRRARQTAEEVAERNNADYASSIASLLS